MIRTSDVWWKNAVLYCLDVETFSDEGFRGATEHLDHLHALGVTCVWLMPFYPTAERDDGYDITDFYNVDPRLGSLGDFVEFVRACRDRGLRVIADLVVNHTSDQHPWFHDPSKRDWYVWEDEPQEDGPQGVTFPDKENSLWEYSEEVGKYYLHRFYKHQPDLNVANPEVRDEIARIMGFWMELGLSGFRVDAVPFLLEHNDAKDALELPDPHDYLTDLRAFLNRRNGEGVLLGEVNLPYKDTMPFYGQGVGDELAMCFDFVGMQAMYLALARKSCGPLTKALQERPKPPRDAHWATFVRNHDELTLDKLPVDERQEVFDAFGPDPAMQLYGRGLRRRLPGMLDGDQRRIRMVYSLLFTLPGTPVLFYGEEVGLEEDLSLEGRLAVRVPMDWEEAGRQRHDEDSLLNWMRRLVECYRECPELAWGEVQVLDVGDPAVFAHRADCDGGAVIVVHNFADQEITVRVPAEGVLTNVMTGETVKPAKIGAKVDLAPYDCRWYRVTTE
ncbi:alpha-amylase family protein [Lentzea jiangxiensis]|uniref:Trehalose synthase n=1 Tax=Lentzea jiangxiensis TaxID=641025 RepID=A0A1H0RRD6_9PSEU|nr:alpha-amylase family protein [Lentzea jiangxiensis]SDP32027.1 trehalose synthase [Lentzea jiangxiensis]